MEILLSVDKQKLQRLDNNFVVGDSKNYLYANFGFSEEWREIPKTAVFKNGTDTYNVPIVNNICKVPHEVLKGSQFLLSVFGGDMITANSVSIRVNQSGLSQGGVPEPPTPSVYAQIYKIADDAKLIAEDLEKRADSGEFKGEKGDDGADGKQGDIGKTGEPGKQGLTGKSAYQYAVEKGFNDSEEHFAIMLASVNKEVRLEGGNAFKGIQTIDNKIVATREMTPTANMLMYWDKNAQTFVSSGISVETLTKLLEVISLENGEVTIKAKVNAKQFNIEV